MLVRIINGTFGYREKDEDGRYSISVQPKTRLDPPFEVDDQIGNDLVRNGIAEIVDSWPKAVQDDPDVNHDPGQNPPTNNEKAEDSNPSVNVDDAVENGTMVPAHLDPEQLKGMTVAKLKELAKEMNIDTAGCKVKDDYIAVITAENVFVDAGDDFPGLSAGDPV